MIKTKDIEMSIGSDVAMMLDDMPLADSNKERVALAVKNTISWAEQCLQHHDKKNQLLFGICQGSAFKDLK